MKVFPKVVVIALLCLLFAATAVPQETLDTLSEKAGRLYQQGRYEEAIEVARKALKMAEENYALDHPNVAASANNLANLYQTQGKYSQAEPLCKRSLAIKKKAEE